AQATADYMEYQGQGWKTNAGAGEPKQVLPTIPLAYRDHETVWQGTFLPDYPKPKPEMPVVLHLALVDGQYRGTLDAPTESMIGEPLDDVRVDHGSIHFTLASEHGPVDFSGSMTARRISGTVTHGGGSPRGGSAPCVPSRRASPLPVLSSSQRRCSPAASLRNRLASPDAATGGFLRRSEGELGHQSLLRHDIHPRRPMLLLRPRDPGN